MTPQKSSCGKSVSVVINPYPSAFESSAFPLCPWIMAIRFPKPVTAHMLRHTVATTLLFNGCPIGHIKEILGHDRLITTCNFYLGGG